MSHFKEGYLNFDEYIRQGEPSQREKAGLWQTAIGLQAVDGLKIIPQCCSFLLIHSSQTKIPQRKALCLEYQQ